MRKTISIKSSAETDFPFGGEIPLEAMQSAITEVFSAISKIKIEEIISNISITPTPISIAGPKKDPHPINVRVEIYGEILDRAKTFTFTIDRGSRESIEKQFIRLLHEAVEKHCARKERHTAILRKMISKE